MNLTDMVLIDGFLTIRLSSAFERLLRWGLGSGSLYILRCVGYAGHQLRQRFRHWLGSRGLVPSCSYRASHAHFLMIL
jgi:hypothetical protein